MNPALALAVITFREGIRNRSVFGILLFSLFILGLNVAVAGFFMRDIGKVSARHEPECSEFCRPAPRPVRWCQPYGQEYRQKDHPPCSIQADIQD